MHEATPFEAITGFLCFIFILGGFVCANFVPRCVDPQKLRAEDDKKLAKFMANPWLPRRILTPTGQKLWKARNLLLALGVLSLIVLTLGEWMHR